MNVEQVLLESKLIPVVEIPDSQLAVPLAEAILVGGISVLEVTFRTAEAAASIQRISESMHEFTVGAGTLLSKDQVNIAIDSGADFGVAPGLNTSTLEHAIKNEFEFIPGINTPSEIEIGLELGIRTFKIFPAEPIGAANLIPAFYGPYPQAKFMPTGGITIENIYSYLRLPNVIACGGTWIAPRELIAKKQFSEITRRTRHAVEILREHSQILQKGK